MYMYNYIFSLFLLCAAVFSTQSMQKEITLHQLSQEALTLEKIESLLALDTPQASQELDELMDKEAARLKQEFPHNFMKIKEAWKSVDLCAMGQMLKKTEALPMDYAQEVLASITKTHVTTYLVDEKGPITFTIPEFLAIMKP